jgi:formylglycine-generating enzyme
MRPRRVHSLAVVAAALLLDGAACSLVVDTKGLAGGAPHGDGSTDEAAPDGPGTADAPDEIGTSNDGGDSGTDGGACNAFSKGPAMVSAGSYCIDSTEVTYGQYSEFVLDKNGSTAGQTPVCTWNTSFGLKCTPLTTEANAPVTCVNWCDAYAFCSWAGKRLCGHIGGGPSATTEAANAATNQWYQACSKGGATAYPYGPTFQPALCNDSNRDAGKPLPVGSLSGCVGGYPGLFDMSGNTIEWTDECSGTTGQNDLCDFRGGAWDDTDPIEACAQATPEQRNLADNTIGFRCCAP